MKYRIVYCASGAKIPASYSLTNPEAAERWVEFFSTGERRFSDYTADAGRTYRFDTWNVVEDTGPETNEYGEISP